MNVNVPAGTTNDDDDFPQTIIEHLQRMRELIPDLIQTTKAGTTPKPPPLPRRCCRLLPLLPGWSTAKTASTN